VCVYEREKERERERERKKERASERERKRAREREIEVALREKEHASTRAREREKTQFGLCGYSARSIHNAGSQRWAHGAQRQIAFACLHVLQEPKRWVHGETIIKHTHACE